MWIKMWILDQDVDQDVVFGSRCGFFGVDQDVDFLCVFWVFYFL